MTWRDRFLNVINFYDYIQRQKHVFIHMTNWFLKQTINHIIVILKSSCSPPPYIQIQIIRKKRLMTTCRVRGQIIFYSCLLRWYYAIEAKRKHLNIFFHDWQMLFFVILLIQCCYNYTYTWLYHQLIGEQHCICFVII
jgi:hypothetical protein